MALDRKALITSAVTTVLSVAALLSTSNPAAAVPGDITTYIGAAPGAGQATAVGQGEDSLLAAGSLVYVGDSANSVVRVIDVTTGNEEVFAGSGTYGSGGDGGPAAAAKLTAVQGLALTPAGDLLLADRDNNVIREVDDAGIISTIAGNGSAGYSGDGGPAASASLSSPLGIATDASGNLFIADSGNNAIREVATDGTITTIAGNGSAGYSGDGGPATAASIQPHGVSVNTAGDLLVADSANNAIRLVDHLTGLISTVAGNGNPGYTGDGGFATAASLNGPEGTAWNPAGGFLIADTLNHVVRAVTPSGAISTLAGTGISAFSGDGGPATAAALSGPYAVAPGSAGSVLIGDSGNARVRVTDAAGTITTLAGTGGVHFGGDGGPASDAQISTPRGLFANPVSGTVYFNDGPSRVRKIDPSGVISTVAGTGAGGSTGDGGPATRATFQLLFDVTADGSGNVYVADGDARRIRRIDASTGTISTYVGTGGPPAPSPVGDGGPATAVDVVSTAVAVDVAGNLVFGDEDRCTVRRVDHVTGTLSTIAGNGTCGAYTGDGGPATAATLRSPTSLASDGSGNLFISAGNSRVLKLSSSGTISTVAGNGLTSVLGDGGPATAARVNHPGKVAWEPGGRLFFDDTGIRIRMVDQSGLISTVAGPGTAPDGLGDGGSALAAKFDVAGLGFDSSHNLLVADDLNGRSRIRRIQAPVPDPPARFVAADFDGDFRADISVFRNGEGSWYDLPSSGGPYVGTPYGTTGDIPVPADYDGDHHTDTAIYRPSVGLWVNHGSSGGGNNFLTYGLSTDIPVPADYDGDGRTDIAVYRPSVGTWYIHRSSDGGDTIFTYGGISGDVPVPADYDGDRRTDIAIFRSGVWYVHFAAGGPDMSVGWGTGGDVPVPGDYNGDQKADLAIYRPATGLWAIRNSLAKPTTTLITYGGITGDMPVAADYDLDGKVDVAIFRPNTGGWFVHRSSGGDTITTFGVSIDTPVAIPPAIRLAFYP